MNRLDFDFKISELNKIPNFKSRLGNNIVTVPEVIDNCSGIRVFGQLLKSFLFRTDVAIIRNTNADAIIAVYPFTPQPLISHSLILASDKPIFFRNLTKELQNHRFSEALHF